MHLWVIILLWSGGGVCQLVSKAVRLIVADSKDALIRRMEGLGLKAVDEQIQPADTEDSEEPAKLTYETAMVLVEELKAKPVEGEGVLYINSRPWGFILWMRFDIALGTVETFEQEHIMFRWFPMMVDIMKHRLWFAPNETTRFAGISTSTTSVSDSTSQQTDECRWPLFLPVPVPLASLDDERSKIRH